ncbi:transcription factor btd-like isoform X8 [Pomacea canaliculata]|uniref:transcription factor btd-like isoform X8 n=1 Tax=Pomacea canaliculata TaxID=400727 RepID=UPI000D737BB3|nr:transcription factor btd-like isoform X8 [Pomacea canaliculata]
MDQESSSKFIGSLTKFLQSLCNGYVDFEDGVELIGHIYLSVDTGKKIDYILNEKVCKSDNSVTFISNSFHAQPADKVKTALGKKSEDKSDGGIRKDDDILSESADSLPRTSNVGPNPGRSVSSLRPGITSQNRGLKRPGSPLISRKASSPPQRRPLTPPSQRRSHLQPAKVSLGSPASSKNIPSSPSSSSQDNIPSPSSKLKTRNDNITSIQTVQIPTDGGDADKDSQVQPTLLPVVQVPDLSSFLGSASSEGQDVSQEHGLATSDDTKPDTDITFIKEEFIPGASSCAQAGTGGQPSGRSMEEQLQDSESPSGLYPVMLHQNTAAFSNTGSGFPTGFPQLGNATATSSRAGYNQSVPSTSASQASADMFSNSVPGTSSQDSSSGDPAEACQYLFGPILELEQGQAELVAVQQVSQGAPSGHYCRYCMYFQPDIVALEQHMLRCKAAQRRHADGGSDDRPTEEDGPLTTADTGGKDTRDNKPFRCTRCGRSYPLAQSLQRHRWKCDQSRPMPCPLCGAIFFRADNLSGHMRSVHRKDSRSPLESTKGPVA